MAEPMNTNANARPDIRADRAHLPHRRARATALTLVGIGGSRPEKEVNSAGRRNPRSFMCGSGRNAVTRSRRVHYPAHCPFRTIACPAMNAACPGAEMAPGHEHLSLVH